VQSVKNPGFTIGLNGLAGNLGIAVVPCSRASW